MFPLLPGFSIMGADTPNLKGTPLVQVFQVNSLETPLCPLTGRTQPFRGALCSRVSAVTPISSSLSTPSPCLGFPHQHLPLGPPGAPSPGDPSSRILRTPLTLHPNSWDPRQTSHPTPQLWDPQQPLHPRPQLLRTLPDPAPHATPFRGPPALMPPSPGTPPEVPSPDAPDPNLPPPVLSSSSRAPG